MAALVTIGERDIEPLATGDADENGNLAGDRSLAAVSARRRKGSGANSPLSLEQDAHRLAQTSRL
jgi:hypothetical protein